MEFPPGIRFKPKDEELIVFYLKPKVDEQPVPPSEINTVDFYQYDPQTLADEHPSRFGQKEWYFFTFREKKYQNGKRPNRSAGNGYWKATAADKPIHLDQTEQIIGYKKNLVYYEGDHKYSRKTDWIMHEYKLPIADPTPPKTEKLPEDENDMRLDSWVICRIHKRETKSKKAELDHNNTRVALPPPPPQEMDERRQHQHHHQQQQLQQQHMDYQQQQQQYNPFPLVDDFFPEDDVYYGQDGFFQPRQQDEGFQPQQQQDEGFQPQQQQDEGYQPQQQQDGFFQPRQQDEGFQPQQQQDEGFQPQQQQDGFFQPRQQDEGFQPQQQQDGFFQPLQQQDESFQPQQQQDEGDEGFQPQQQQDGFFQPRQQDEGFQRQQQQDGFFQPRQQDQGFQPQQQSDSFFRFFQPQQDEEYSEYVASLLYYRSLSS